MKIISWIILGILCAAGSAYAEQDLLVQCSLDGGGRIEIDSAPQSNGQDVTVKMDSVAKSKMPLGVQLPSRFEGWLDTSDIDDGIIGMGFDAPSPSDASEYIASLGEYDLPPAGNSPFDGGIKNLMAVRPDLQPADLLSMLRSVHPNVSIYVGVSEKHPIARSGRVYPGGQDVVSPLHKRASINVILNPVWITNGYQSSAPVGMGQTTFQTCTVGPKLMGRFTDLRDEHYLKN